MGIRLINCLLLGVKSINTFATMLWQNVIYQKGQDTLAREYVKSINIVCGFYMHLYLQKNKKYTDTFVRLVDLAMCQYSLQLTDDDNFKVRLYKLRFYASSGYIPSITSAYFSIIIFRFNFNVGVISSSSCENSFSSRANLRTCSKSAKSDKSSRISC